MPDDNSKDGEGPAIRHAGWHLLVTWCLAVLLVVFGQRFGPFFGDLGVPVLASLLSAVCFLGCCLQVFVTIMALIKARGWDYIGIFMLYGYWLCAGVVAFSTVWQCMHVTHYSQ